MVYTTMNVLAEWRVEVKSLAQWASLRMVKLTKVILLQDFPTLQLLTQPFYFAEGFGLLDY
jgi:hypothetical protein